MSQKIKYRPLGNRILVEPIEITQEEKMVGSIELAESAIVLQRGIVLAVGRGEMASQNGIIVPCETQVGNTVLFRKECPYLPIRFPGDEKEYRLIRENDIECILP